MIIDGNDLVKHFGVVNCSDNNLDNQILDEVSEESSILLDERPQTLVLPAKETSLLDQLEKQREDIPKENVTGETRRENVTHLEQNLIGKEISKRELTEKKFTKGEHSNELTVVPGKIDWREGNEKRKPQEAKRAEVSKENNTEYKLPLKTKDDKSIVFATLDAVSNECGQGIEYHGQDESVFQTLNTEVVKLTEFCDESLVSASYQV